MDIVGEFFELGPYIGIDYASGDFTAGVQWAFFDDRWHVTVCVPFMRLHLKYDFRNLAAVRRAVSHVSGVVSVDRGRENGQWVYYIGVDHWDPELTRNIAKCLAGMGVYYHVVPVSIEAKP